MDKILEALKNLLPEESLKEVASAVNEMLTESRNELEGEFNEHLEKAYQELSGELQAAEKIAEQGYAEAYAIISDLRNRLEVQREEFEQTLEEGYEEAYQMLLAERNKNTNIETDIYNQYDKKLQEMRDFMVDKVHQFLELKGPEIYTQAKKDVLNNPNMASQKVALDKIVEITSNYLCDEDRTFATGTKLTEAQKQIEDMKTQIRMMEARNIRLSGDNQRLNEQLRQAGDLISESRQVDKKERAQKAKNVSGRGHKELKNVKVLSEYSEESTPEVQDDDTNTLLEGIDLATVNLLAGTSKAK